MAESTELTYAQRYYQDHKDTMKRQSTEARRVRRRRLISPARPARPVVLSPRERQVLELIGEGYQNKEIAARLNLALGTIKNTTNRLYTKLQVRSRVDAVRWAVQESEAR